MFALYRLTSFFTMESHEQAASFFVNNIAILPQILDVESLVVPNEPFTGEASPHQELVERKEVITVPFWSFVFCSSCSRMQARFNEISSTTAPAAILLLYFMLLRVFLTTKLSLNYFSFRVKGP
jgi:hypothetical protein